jgi:protein-S-isoprenylcysteine O-methyltransferase Ste14
VLYGVLVAAFVVRIELRSAGVRERIHPVQDDPVWLTRIHHLLLMVVLLGAPIERLALGGRAEGRLLGAVAFATGVLVYRLAGCTLGDALSPFTQPRATTPLVTAGPYRWIRHPMYLSQALVGIGAPLTLGSRYVLAVALLLLCVLVVRTAREEEALARTFPEYARYAARTKRLVPFVY